MVYALRGLLYALPDWPRPAHNNMAAQSQKNAQNIDIRAIRCPDRHMFVICRIHLCYKLVYIKCKSNQSNNSFCFLGGESIAERGK